MKMPSMTVDKVKEAFEAIDKLTRIKVLVGVPSDKADRVPSYEDPTVKMNNAALAYIHENGAPEANIPARPFLVPGVRGASQKIAERFGSMAKRIISVKQGRVNASVVETGFKGVGLIAQSAVKKKITDGPFEALAPATVAARRARHKGRKANTAKDTRPLIDTGAMRNSINFVLRIK